MREFADNSGPLCVVDEDGSIAFRQSFINQFCRCPAQGGFYLSHGPRAPGLAAVAGQGAHRAFEQGCKFVMNMGHGYVFQPGWGGSLVATAEDHLDRCLRGDVMMPPDLAPAKAIGKTRDDLIRTVQRFAIDVLPTLQPEQVEWRVLITVPIEEGPGVTVSTAIDLVQVGGILEDFKTGRRVDDEVARTSRQLTVQAMAYFLSTKGRMPSQLGLRRINAEGSGAHWTTRSIADMNAYLGIARQVASCVRAGLFPPCGEGAWWCSSRWCGWHKDAGGPCPHGR